MLDTGVQHKNPQQGPATGIQHKNPVIESITGQVPGSEFR